MTLLPQIKAELAAAAERNEPRRSAKRPRSFLPRGGLLAATAILATAATASAVAIATGVVGGPPTNAFPRHTGEEQGGFARASAPTVLGVVRAPKDARPVELVGYRAAYRGRSQICLDLGLPDGSNSGSCSREIPATPREFLGATETPHGRLFTGATRTPVTEISIAYQLRGRPHTTRAELIRINGVQARRLGTTPFTFFAATAPRRAARAEAIARDAQGRTVWRVSVSN